MLRLVHHIGATPTVHATMRGASQSDKQIVWRRRACRSVELCTSRYSAFRMICQWLCVFNQITRSYVKTIPLDCHRIWISIRWVRIIPLVVESISNGHACTLCAVSGGELDITARYVLPMISKLVNCLIINKLQIIQVNKARTAADRHCSAHCEI